MALPNNLQLRRCLPAWYQHHQGDPGGLLGDRGATRLSPKDSGWDSLWESLGAESAPGAEPAPDAGSSPGAYEPEPRVADPARPAAEPQLRPGGPVGQAASSILRTIIVRTDGAARGNPGPASSGAVLIEAVSPASRRPGAPPIASISEYLGVQTNNVAEYTAVVRALALAEELGAEAVEMLLDSKLIVEQLHGRWRVKDAKLIPLHADAKARLARFSRWSATHVPRAQNKQADALCNEAIDRALAGGPRVVVVRP